MKNKHSFLVSFKKALEKGLPGELSHKIVLPVKTGYQLAGKKELEFHHESAVGIILYPSQSTIHCILIQRPEYEGVHGGQISFPGGKKDVSDFDLEQTARRECYEEINLPTSSALLIAELSEIYISVSSFLVRPFVFFIDELPSLTPDPREVASIISFDLFSITDESIVKTTDFKTGNGIIRKNIPYFDIDGNKVWGATAMMLAEMKSILERFD